MTGSLLLPRWLVVAGIAAALIVPTASLADNTDLMVIVSPAGSYRSDQYATPIYPTRALRFTIAYDPTYYEGDTIQCQLETWSYPPGPGPPTTTPWGSCGPTASGSCPKSVCYSYIPPITRDANYTVYTRLVDANGDEEGGAGQASFDFQVDTTPPQTRLTLSYFGISTSPSGNGSRAAFTFTTDDPNAHFQCSLSPTWSTSGPWKPCRSGVNIPFRIPLTTQLVKFSVRAVDPFGRPDASPPTYAFSAIPCRARLLSRPRTLAALASAGMRVRITCVTPSAWHFVVVPTTPLARQLEISELAGYRGLFRRPGESRTIRVKAIPLRDFPTQFTSQPLPVAFMIYPSAIDYDEFGAPQRILGRLAPT